MILVFYNILTIIYIIFHSQQQIRGGWHTYCIQKCVCLSVIGYHMLVLIPSPAPPPIHCYNARARWHHYSYWAVISIVFKLKTTGLFNTIHYYQSVWLMFYSSIYTTTTLLRPMTANDLFVACMMRVAGCEPAGWILSVPHKPNWTTTACRCYRSLYNS